jgi:NAD-dependent dihydropyrimidine dehydrogenase PreA subunit
VDKEKCNRDGICVAECPTQVLRLEQGDPCPVPSSDFGEVCLRCGHCVAVCPTGAFNLDWLRADECLSIRKDFALSPKKAEQFLRSRRSIRVFESEPVERSQIERLIQIACHAPSAKNAQPWSWVIIEDPLKLTDSRISPFSGTSERDQTRPNVFPTMSACR